MLRPILRLLAFAPIAFASAALHAQAARTQSRGFTFSAFAGATATETGFLGSRNLAFTAGFDITARPDLRFSPALELRGSYPVDRGSFVSEENFLIGPRLNLRVLPRLRVYADAFWGRNSMDYGAGAYAPDFSVIYQTTDGNLYAAGGGLTYDLTPSFALKADAQT